MTIDEGYSSPSKHTPGKKLKRSPTKKSPGKQKIIVTPTKLGIDNYDKIELNGKFNLDVDPKERNGEFTLEGIAGMVQIQNDSSEENFYSLPM